MNGWHIFILIFKIKKTFFPAAFGVVSILIFSFIFYLKIRFLI